MILLRLELECGETLLLEDIEEWTCRLHPFGPIDEDDYDCGIPEFGCSCATRARWRRTGELRLLIEHPISKVLKEWYVPSIKEQLNQEVIFLASSRNRRP